MLFFSSINGYSLEPNQAKEQLSPQESLKARLQEFTASQHKNNIEKEYNTISTLWEDVAQALKTQIKERPDHFEESQESFLNWQARVSSQFDLLKKVSKQREKYLAKLSAQGKSLFQTDEKTGDRILLEVTLIPYKALAYFYEKSFWIRKNTNTGFSGYFHLIVEIIILFMILLVPFFFFKVAKKVEKKIESQKRKSFYLSFRSQWHRGLTSFLNIISEYLPWIFSFMALKLVGFLLLWSEFQELAHLLPYFYFYIYYKVFRVTLEFGLREFASNLKVESKEQTNQKIQKTSRLLGLVVFVIYSLKTAFMTTLGESLIFSIIRPFFGILILVWLFIVSARWKKEVKDYLNNSNLVILQRYADLMHGQLASILSLPGLIVILAHFMGKRVVEWSSKYDFVKRIYARVLKVKYESTRGDEDAARKVPQEYIEAFGERSQNNIQDNSLKSETFEAIDKQVKAWGEGKNIEQTVAIYGPQGSGKSVFLSQCQSAFSEQGIEVIEIKVPPKVFTEKSFDALFEDILAIPEDKKAIVLIDDAHNFFISTIGGFKTYQSFLEKMEEMRNIFWIAAFSDLSWQFLNNVLGKNQYFRLELKMPRWSSDSLKAMILQSHPNEQWKLAYDQIFRSSQRLHEGVTSAENRYFYFIWEKAHGYPGLAISYWFKSLQPVANNQMKVLLPRENAVNELSQLHQEAHFVYAAVLKHDNLNISEATRATNMPRAVVKQAMYRGYEEGFLLEDDGRYSVNIDWLDDLRKFLKGKNLLYEN